MPLIDTPSANGKADPKMLRSPYPWFGGKSRIAASVWRRFGDVRNYVEPFFGSGAVLLQRPRPFVGTETINDVDGFVSNFWRAIQADPEAVARWTDWPVSEIDLHARHLWLVNAARQQVERLREEPEFFDAKIAGWWVWGVCQWIGSGWCHHPEWQQLHHLGNVGRGVHRPSQKRPHLGDAGRGDASRLPERGQGRPPSEPESPLTPSSEQIYEYFRLLSERFRRVRVCCGDWSRVCGPTPTVKLGLTAVFLDPPYSDKAGRDSDIYAHDCGQVAHEVREWAIANGDDHRMRIALCGYDGEHSMPDTWECLAWKAKGGYGSQGDGTPGKENAKRERIWFSPHCLRLKGYEPPVDLFGAS